MGDLQAVEPGSPEDEVLAGWLRDAIEHGDEWLDGFDEAGVPRRLLRCESYADLLATANEDYFRHGWRLLVR